MKLMDQKYAVQKMLFGACIKILVNYSQSIAIIQSLNLNWSSVLSYLFIVNKTGSGNIQGIVGLECVFEGIINVNKKKYIFQKF